jgi:hypothetical protein
VCRTSDFGISRGYVGQDVPAVSPLILVASEGISTNRLAHPGNVGSPQRTQRSRPGACLHRTAPFDRVRWTGCRMLAIIPAGPDVKNGGPAGVFRVGAMPRRWSTTASCRSRSLPSAAVARRLSFDVAIAIRRRTTASDRREEDGGGRDRPCGRRLNDEPHRDPAGATARTALDRRATSGSQRRARSTRRSATRRLSRRVMPRGPYGLLMRGYRSLTLTQLRRGLLTSAGTWPGRIDCADASPSPPLSQRCSSCRVGARCMSREAIGSQSRYPRAA